MNPDISNYSSLDIAKLIEGSCPTIASHFKVIDAIIKMRRSDDARHSHYNYILILEESKLIGILTERDIVKLTATETNLTTTTIEQVMTTKLITLKKSHFTNIYSILKILKNNQIRHLPVVNDSEELEGVISVESICQALHPSNLLKFRLVQEAITTKILHAPLNTSVLSLSQMMSENRSSCVVITKEKLLENQAESPVSLLIPVGIVTERDIVQLQLLGLDMLHTIAQAVMSSPLFCMKLTDSLMEVREQMAKLQVRRLVIVGEKSELKGIINQLDILKVLDPKELLEIIETLQQELDQKTQQLQKEKELAQVTLQSIGDAVITTDIQGNIVICNSMAEKLINCQASEAIGSPLSKFFRIFDENTKQAKPNLIKQIVHNNQDMSQVSHALLIAQNSIEYIIENSATPIRDHQGEIVGIAIVFRDVTTSRILTDQLSWQASHDVLTGLSNRRKFEQELNQALALSQQKMCQHALCYLDLDRFKVVNDTCGHAAGDEILRQVSDIFREQVRSSDVLARLGGDEFGILLYRCSISKAKKISDKLRQAINDFRFIWEEKTFSIGVSIGITEINSHTKNITSSLSEADAACYRAKKQGRNCVAVNYQQDV